MNILNLTVRLPDFLTRRLEFLEKYTVLAVILLSISATEILFTTQSVFLYNKTSRIAFSLLLLVLYGCILFYIRISKHKLKRILITFADLPVFLSASFLLPESLFQPSLGEFYPDSQHLLGMTLLGFILTPWTLRIPVLFLFSLAGALMGNFEQMLFLGMIGVVVAGVLEKLRRLPWNRLRMWRIPSTAEKVNDEEVEMPEDEGIRFTLRVINQEGNPVAGAMVSLYSRELGLKEIKETDSEGRCTFEGLEEGEYEITISDGETQKTLSRYLVADSGEVVTLEEKIKEEAGEEAEIFAGESALIVYSSQESLNELIQEIVKEHVENDREVLIASMPPRADEYSERFEKYIKEGRVRIIRVPLRGKLPESDKNIQEIPMTNLEYFTAVFEEMPAGALFIFEPLGSTILNLGRNQAYRFISRASDFLSREGLFFISFLNKNMEEEVQNFRDLFSVVAEIRGKKLFKL